MERQSGSMEVCSPLYVSRMLNVPLEEVKDEVPKILVMSEPLVSFSRYCLMKASKGALKVRKMQNEASGK